MFLSLSFWCKRSIFICKLFIKGFVACGLPVTHFLKGLAFPRSAKLISRMVWHFRARRKSFPEWFGISALGESHFPKGLAFPRMAKVVSRKVWHFRAWQKLSLESLMFAYLVMKEGVVIHPYMTNITRLYITF